MTFQAGDTVGTYRIIAKLGSGGMGEVFEAEHLVTKRVEALKVLTAEAAGTPEQDLRFQREIQLQAGLRHPNIAEVHHAFRENGHLVMIMELIRGRPLKSLLEDGRLPLRQSINYACQALAALDYAHGHSVIHRDISPSNMIVAEDGTLKLTDFGLAKSARDLRLTQSGTVIGSLYYTSPEQVRGRTEADDRSDIYSLGAVLYEMATGVKAFWSDNPFALMLAHVEQAPRRPGEVDGSLPVALDEIIMTALEKNPKKRFQSAALFRQALESLARGLEGGTQHEAHACRMATNPAPIPTNATRARRYGQTIAAVTVAVALAVAIRGLYLPAFKALPNRGEDSRSAGLAALPFLWPADLVQVPELSSAPHEKPVERRGASEVRHQPPRKRNAFLRAISRVLHPFHHDSQAATAEPSQ